MKAAVLQAYGQFEWTEVPTPDCGPTQVLIKVSYAGICGSDLHVYKGEFDGRTPIPFIPGHEFAGTVAKVGADVDHLKAGDLVVGDPIVWCGQCAACQLQHYPACTSLKLVGIDFDGGFAEYVVVEGAMVYAIPPGIDPKHAALVEVLSIGFHACNRAQVQTGHMVAIWGGGRVGHCILQAARTHTDQTIFLIDIVDERLAIAARSDEHVVAINALKEDPLSIILEQTSGRGVDVAFEAVGHANALEQTGEPIVGCIHCIRPAGVVCVLGLSDHAVPVLFKSLIWKEAHIITSRVSHGEFAETIDALQRQTLKPEILITSIVPAFQVQATFDNVANSPQENLKVLLDFT
jgi:threonine dehydrogenase-like Zn-dependent dehydrogenase